MEEQQPNIPDGPFDAVVIGSGLGGLTCGAFLARAGMRVLVLEKHTRIGGYAHGFRRKGFQFESGIHSVPFGPDGMIMHLLRLLKAEHRVTPVPINTLYTTRCGDFSYTLPSASDAILEQLNRDFPRQRANIARFMAEAGRMFDAMMRPVFDYENTFTEENREFASQYIGKSYKQFVDSFIDDESLRFILYSQWPYGATPPDFSPVLYYTFMFHVHQQEGSHSCKGGFQSLAQAVASVIREHGGVIRTGRAVVGVHAEKGRVGSVELDNGEVIAARICVSNISPYVLHRELVQTASRNRIWLRRLENLRPSPSCIAVYCGFKDGMETLGNDGVTFWFQHRDNARIFRNIMEGNVAADDHLLLLQSQEEGPRTAMLMCLAQADAEKDWKTAKMVHAQRMIDRMETLFPGTRDHLEHIEVGSPRTFERYTGNTDGAIYGFQISNDIYSEAKLPPRTYLPNLYQTGHWGKPGGGVWNVMVNGYTVSKMILRDRG